jgi:hypothetical protein
MVPCNCEPRPNWLVTEPLVRMVLKMSLNTALLALKPTVLTLEILSPMIPMAWEFDDRPVTPVNNELIKDMVDLLFPFTQLNAYF